MSKKAQKTKKKKEEPLIIAEMPEEEAKKPKTIKEQQKEAQKKKSKKQTKKTATTTKSLPPVRASEEKKPQYVQDFIPIKTLHDGIIETTDGRFVMILEVEPINFSLRSKAEQVEVIMSFAQWLKICPVKVQFKSMTKRADSAGFIRRLRDDARTEKNKNCKKVTEDYIELIDNLGTREALTRKFLLICEYEPLRKAESGGASVAVSSLRQVEQTARQYFNMCGNDIIKWKNPNKEVTTILYEYFNRRTYGSFPVESRINRIASDYYKSKKYQPGEAKKVPLRSIISPKGINFTNYGYFIMDGLYYCIYYIKGNGYPTIVPGGWSSFIVNAGEGVDVDIFLTREDRSKTLDRVSRRIRLQKAKQHGKNSDAADYESLESTIESGMYIKQSVSQNNEDLFYMSTFITLSAPTKKSLMWKKKQFEDIMKSQDFSVSCCNFVQEKAFVSVLPLCKVDKDFEKVSRQNVMTLGAAASYMFTSFEMSDDNGVMLGVNAYNNSLCVIDLFNTKKHMNANMNILGKTGSGKTFTMQLLALRMRMRGIQVFIIAPEKGFEFKRACDAIGGSFINISSGSPQCINVMEIRHTVSPTMELIDDISFDEMDSMLAKKIQQLLSFFSLLIPDMTNEEEQLLDDALIKTYNQFGITNDNESVYDDIDANPPVLKHMPVLGDLYNNLKRIPRAERVAVILSRFVTGSSQSFNKQTNVDLNNKFTVIDLSDLKGKLLPVGMMIALDFIWDKIKEDRTVKKAIFVDEIWKLLGADGNKDAAEFCLNIFKTIRGYGGAAIAATQNLSDFFALDDGKFGKGIINNSKNKIVLGLEENDGDFVQEVLHLSDTEIRTITRFQRGEAMILSGPNKLPVEVKASKKETDLITTDREELARIRNEKAEQIKKMKGIK